MVRNLEFYSLCHYRYICVPSIHAYRVYDMYVMLIIMKFMKCMNCMRYMKCMNCMKCMRCMSCICSMKCMNMYECMHLSRSCVHEQLTVLYFVIMKEYDITYTLVYWYPYRWRTRILL